MGNAEPTAMELHAMDVEDATDLIADLAEAVTDVHEERIGLGMCEAIARFAIGKEAALFEAGAPAAFRGD